MSEQSISPCQHQALASLCEEGDYLQDPNKLRKDSKDYYWYSPRLTPLLDHAVAEAIIRIRSLDSLVKIVDFAAKEGVALTPRGAATGNYGQATPINGGLLLDLRPLTEKLSLDKQSGILKVSAGVRCQTIEEYARPFGWEMPMYPSTWVKSTIGGFLAGGSAGIGSIRNGILRDGKMVKSLTVLDGTSPPALHHVEGPDCLSYLHAYGVNGFIVETELQLVPKLPWEQLVFSSVDPMKLFAFGHALAEAGNFRLRLLNFQQWPIPRFFIPLRKHYPDEHSILQLEVASEDLESLIQLADSKGFKLRLHLPHKEPRRAPMLSDFVQNHSTLWAKKDSSDYTYLAAKIDFTHWEESVEGLMKNKDPVFALRADFNRSQGKPAIAAGPIFQAPDLATLKKAEAAFESLGIYFYDVHSPFLDRRGMEAMHTHKIGLKELRDPKGILSSGKLSAEAPELAQSISSSW